MKRKYKIQEVVCRDGHSDFYPLYKDFLVWRYFRIDHGYFTEIISKSSKEEALEIIEKDKKIMDSKEIIRVKEEYVE